MTRSYVIGLALLIGFGLAFRFWTPPGQVVQADAKVIPDSQVGRYQFFKSAQIAKPYEECLLDTTTGKVWALRFDEKLKAKWVLAVEHPR